MDGSKAPRMAKDQRRKGPRSDAGTESRVQMISTGTAAAKRSIRSHSRRSRSSAKRSATKASKRRATGWMFFGFKASAMVRRTRVW